MGLLLIHFLIGSCLRSSSALFVWFLGIRMNFMKTMNVEKLLCGFGNVDISHLDP